MTAVLIGYDVEACAIGEGLACLGAHTGHGMGEAIDRTATRRGLEVILRNHEEFEAPATLFVCGRTLVHNVDVLAPFVEHPLFDIQQHTYSHVLLKDDGWKGGTFLASPPEAVWQEITQTNEAFRRLLGVEIYGLRTPHGYFRGISDRPEMLEVVSDCGIRFISSWGRNAEGGNPTPMSIQPYWYADQGYPDLLEIPFQGWLDGTWFEEFGIDRGREYAAVLVASADEAARADGVYGACFHDWAQIRYGEAETRWVNRLLSHCRAAGIPLSSYAEYYQQRLSQRSERSG
jgi:peptidoglycan/xylan/chitin deacetylase (PgdA/CDA1 family)